MIPRRGRFRDLVDRQLDLFEADTELLAEAREADEAWSRADAAESEELYGDYLLVVDALADALAEIRESYAMPLDAETAEEYRREFDRAARKRFGRHAPLAEEAE